MSSSATMRGVVVGIRGAVVDVRFSGRLPPIHALVRLGDLARAVVRSHVSDDVVRTIAVEPTRGLRLGADGVAQSEPMSVPVGEALLGRVVDLFGQPLDGRGPVDSTSRRGLHQPPPAARERRPWSDVYPTGIKVVDLFCPFLHGGRAAVFGGAGVGKTVILTEFIHSAIAQLSVEALTRVGLDVDADTARTLRRGRVLRQLLRQDRLSPRSVADHVLLLHSVASGLLDELDPEEAPARVLAALLRWRRRRPEDAATLDDGEEPAEGWQERFVESLKVVLETP